MQKLLSFLERHTPVKRSVFSKLMGNVYPPYLGAGVRVTHVSEDFTAVDVKLKRSWWNANYVGTQFGGSIFSMADPWIMIMLMNQLAAVAREARAGAGQDPRFAEARPSSAEGAGTAGRTRDKYLVWDKSASIRFLTPGTGDIVGRFRVDTDTLQTIKDSADRQAQRHAQAQAGTASGQGTTELPPRHVEPVFTVELVQKRVAAHSAGTPLASLASGPGRPSTAAGPLPAPDQQALRFQGTAPAQEDELVVAVLEKRLYVRKLTSA